VGTAGRWASRVATRAARRHLVGPQQRWLFERPVAGWVPPPVERTSLYLHVPFCRNACPYCPYTKVPYAEDLVEPYTDAALAEVDLWAGSTGPAEVTSVYVGGGTPTLVPDAIERIVDRVHTRFTLTGDVCVETNPADIDERVVDRLRGCGVSMVSLGVQSFRPESLAAIGRDYEPRTAEHALSLLASSGFASVNADLMFALPGQTTEDVIADLEHAVELGADQVTVYPLFTFPYTPVGRYLQLRGVRLPDLSVRHGQYRAIARWCADNGFERVSVWGFRRAGVPRYSSVTRDGYVGIGPGAGSHLTDGFVLNTFDLDAWTGALGDGRLPLALRMRFGGEMAGWWWLYWRLYDTRVPLGQIDKVLGSDAPKARRWLALIERAGLAVRDGGTLSLTDEGAFWLHLAQNHFALSYINTLWTAARREAWPSQVRI